MTILTATLHAHFCIIMLIFDSVLPIITNVSDNVLEDVKAQNVITLTFYQNSCHL